MKNKLKIVFTKVIPEYANMEENTLYISMEYETVVHKCACGCGMEVVTPLSEADWQLKFDGKVSLKPSIGNWDYPCKSHYFIIDNEVVWASQWKDKRIKKNRKKDKKLLNKIFKRKRC